ncbi:MAG: hypothetical protein KY466_06855 [Gemmatimonadetes bacterium]|nr:hypothetical protein [Gemmatimonadota bacterium]
MRHAILTAAVAAVLTAGCAAGTPEGDEPGPRGETAMVRVENHNWADVNVYALIGGTPHRLGMVVTSRAETFRLPRALLARHEAVRFRVNVIGSRESYMTAPIQVSRGDRIDFEITNHLPLSNYMVRVAGVF